MATKDFLVVACGDSIVWGQGLAPEQKFVQLATRRLGELLGRPAQLVLHTARSGATLEQEPARAVLQVDPDADLGADERRAFVDLYPWAFPDQSARDEFIIHGFEGRTLFLDNELPCSFPTVGYQLLYASEEIRKTGDPAAIDLLIVNGGGNDLDFAKILDPTGHRDDFVTYFDPQIEEVFYRRVRDMLRKARESFPNAYIMMTGYYSPVAPGVTLEQVKKLLQRVGNSAAYEIWFNDHIIELVDDEQLALEATIRAQYALERVLHWSRKAVAEASRDPESRGPGICFVHPQFGPENTLFGDNSFVFSDFELDDVKDPAKPAREAACPRFQQREAMRSTLNAIRPPGSVHAGVGATKAHFRALRQSLNGPQSLLDALGKLSENNADTSALEDAATALKPDLDRIERAQRASFVHPKPEGAIRYSEEIAKRFDAWHRSIQFRDDVRRLSAKGLAQTGNVGLKGGLERYGLPRSGSLRLLKQSFAVDSIRIDTLTAPNSQKDMIDDIFLDVGGDRRWKLNFPVTVIAGSEMRMVRKLHPQFEPGMADTFTIDGRGFHLGDIKQLVLERSHGTFDFSEGAWIFVLFTLYVNGEVVFHSAVPGALARGERLTLPYPLG